MSYQEREVSNADRAPAIPRVAHELADYAAHHLAELHTITSEAPLGVRADLRSIATTFERVTLYLDAIFDEGPDCWMRIAARAQVYEERLKAQHIAQPEWPIATLMIALFREHNDARFGPGHARARGVGFQHHRDLP